MVVIAVPPATVLLVIPDVWLGGRRGGLMMMIRVEQVMGRILLMILVIAHVVVMVAGGRSGRMRRRGEAMIRPADGARVMIRPDAVTVVVAVVLSVFFAATVVGIVRVGGMAI